MTQTATHRTLDRLLAVDWANDNAAYDNVESRAHLMVEYLRRAALWVEALGIGDEWPFVDVAAHVAPGLRTDPAVLDRLAGISVHIAWPPVRKVVEAALHWATVRDTPGVPVPDLPDPYEPLLVMFERGGAFTAEHGFIDVGMQMIPVKTWQERRKPEQFVSLDAATLDALDGR